MFVALLLLSWAFKQSIWLSNFNLMILNEGTGLCCCWWAASRLFRNLRFLFSNHFPSDILEILMQSSLPFMTHLCTKVGDTTPVKVFWICEFMWKQKKKPKKQLKESLCCLLSSPERLNADNVWPLWGEHVADIAVITRDLQFVGRR